MLVQAVTRNAVILGAFAISTAALLALTHENTRERINCNRIGALQASLHEVFPEPRADNNLLADMLTVTDPRLGRGEHFVYRARLDNQPSGLVMESVAPDGYSGAIRLLVGVDYQGEVTGVRVVPPHQETPGLGDKIETRKSDWIRSFDGHSLEDTPTENWAVKKDGGEFDQFTGATITPRAVVGAVHRALQYYQENRDSLFDGPAEVTATEQCDD